MIDKRFVLAAAAAMAVVAGLWPRLSVAQSQAWTAIGPLGIQSGGSAPTTYSGRVDAIAVDPLKRKHWLIGAPQGGIWETTDAGQTWTPRTDDKPSLAMGAIAFSQQTDGVRLSNIVYAGTGDAVFHQDAYGAAGLLKSIDGGVSWSGVTTTPANQFAGAAFKAIAVKRTNSSVLLAATSRGYRSSSATLSARGVFRSTDGGATWKQSLQGNATALAVQPRDFAKVYAGIGEMFGSEAGASANGLYRSTDGGQTFHAIDGPWTSLAGGIGRIELTLSKSDPKVLYVSIQDAVDGTAEDGNLLGLWRTDNAWAKKPTFASIPLTTLSDGTSTPAEFQGEGYCAYPNEGDNQPTPYGRCWVVHTVSVDPKDPDTLYAGGIHLWKCTTCNAASAQWTDLSAMTGAIIHTDQQVTLWAGTKRLLVGNDGGLWSTTDDGSTWTSHNAGLGITQFVGGALHPTNPNKALAGSKDVEVEVWNGSSEWTLAEPLVPGDGNAAVFAEGVANNSTAGPYDPDLVWAAALSPLRIFKTHDGGATWPGAMGAGAAAIDATGAGFNAPFVKCPNNDDVFLAGSTKVWKTQDFFVAGASHPQWSAEFDLGQPITTLGFAPSDTTCNTAAFGGVNGAIRITTDGGATWVPLDASGQVPNRAAAISAIAFDPANADVLYAALLGFDDDVVGQPGHVFKTSNARSGSATWTNISPPGDVQARAVVVDPHDSSSVYVGTDLGVWKSGDGGASWTHLDAANGYPGLPNTVVNALQINRTTGKLAAFTFGRGAFVLSLP